MLQKSGYATAMRAGWPESDPSSFTHYLLYIFFLHTEVEGIYVITSGVPDEPKVTELTLFIYLRRLRFFLLQISTSFPGFSLKKGKKSPGNEVVQIQVTLKIVAHYSCQDRDRSWSYHFSPNRTKGQSK